MMWPLPNLTAQYSELKRCFSEPSRYKGAMSTPALLITGGAKRIGRAIALHAAGQGYDIALHYHSSKDQAEQTAADIRALERNVVLLQADLSEPHSAEPLIAAAKQAMPHLNALVLNASIFAPSPLMQTDEAMLHRYLQLHVSAPFFLAQSYAKHVGRGSIVALLDTNVTAHASVHFSYLLSKKALASLVPMLARELAPAIRVNAVAPGLTSLSDDVSPERAAEMAASLPLASIATPQQIAGATAYLLAADYITGQTLYVDGGQHLL